MPADDIIPDNLLDELRSRKGPRPPVSVLREQAAELRHKTDGLLGGAVTSYNADGSSLVCHTFYLVVPSLDDLSYSLFYAWHDATKPYPVHVLLVGNHSETPEPARPKRLLKTPFERSSAPREHWR